MKRRTVLAAHGLMAACGWIAAADAAQITYDWTGGSVTLTADNASGTDLLAAGQSIPLTSASQVTFDAVALTIPSFNFSDAGPTTVPLEGPLAGFSLELSNVSVVPDATYSSSATGTNPYNFTLGALDASGSYEVLNASNTVVANGTFSHSNPTLSGQLTLGTGSDSLTLNGITLGAFTADGQQITLKGDVVFSGEAPVPVPAAIWLFGSGLMGLAGLVRRRRAA